MQWLGNVGNWAHGHNLMGIIFNHVQTVLPLLGLAGLLLISVMDRKYVSRGLAVATFFVSMLTYGVWQLNVVTPLLLAAGLMSVLAVWSVIVMIRTLRLPSTAGEPRFAKPAWLAFVATALTISLASVLDLVEVYFFGEYVKPQAGPAGLVDMSLFALRGLTWDAASVASMVMIALVGLYLVFRRPEGNAASHQQPEAC